MEETQNARTLGGRLGWLIMQATLDSNMGRANPLGREAQPPPMAFAMNSHLSVHPASYLWAHRRRATAYTSCSTRPAHSAPNSLAGYAPQS